MIENLIFRLKLENENLTKKIKEISKSNKIHEICAKILNGISITEEELDILHKTIEKTKSLSSLDKETLEFILFIIPSGDTLDDKQKKTIKNLMSTFNIAATDELENKLHRNERFIDLLESNQIFVYFEQLTEILKEYNYTTKDILKIIKILIKNNYSAEIKKEESNIDNSNNEQELVEEVIEELNEETSLEIVKLEESDSKEEKEDTQGIQKSDTNDEEDLSNIEIINSDEEILKLFKRYKLFYTNLDEKFKKMLRTNPIDFEDKYAMFDLLKTNGFNIKSMYNENQDIFVEMILKSNAEMVRNIINICKDRKIDLKKTYKIIQDIFISDENDGVYDTFVNNIEFLDSISFDYSLYKTIYLYGLNTELLKYKYRLLTDVYKFNLYEQTIDYFYCITSITVIDRIIEMDPEKRFKLESSPDTLLNISPQFSYALKKQIKTLKYAFSFENIEPLSYESAMEQAIYEFKEEDEDELTEYLNSKLERFETDEGDVCYDIPFTNNLSQEVLNHPLVVYIEKNYSSVPFLYNIRGTTVSRIKVLRVLNYFALQGIEITEEVVKYAMKLNFIFLGNDLENINAVFKNKTK